MPTRMIRESLLDSDRYWSVPIEARELYRHLQLLADDFGCVSLAYAFVRRRCFDCNPTLEKVSMLIGLLNDADLIRVYDHDGSRYGFIPRFRQRLQRLTLKNPVPPESLLFGDDDAKIKFKQINNKSNKPTVGQPVSTVLQPSTPVCQPPEVEVEVEVKNSKSKPLSGSSKTTSSKPDVTRPEEWNFKEPPKPGTEPEYVLACFNKVTKSKYKAVDPTLRLIRARLSEHTIPAMKHMIVYMAEKWEGDEKMCDYVRPQTFFNATNCQSYVEQARKAYAPNT